MAALEILSVWTIDSASDRLHGFSLEAPTAGAVADVYALRIEGSYVPRQIPQHEPSELFLVAPGRWAEKVRPNVPRPEVADAYPGVPWADRSGFRVEKSVLGLPSEFEVHLVEQRPGMAPLSLGRVSGRRQQLPKVDEGLLQPIMLTTLGRTGGTWITHVLAQHPAILALQPFAVEPRVAIYWADVFAALSTPSSYLQCLGAEMVDDRWWWLGKDNRGPLVTADAAPKFGRWLGKQNVDDLLAFCLGRIQRAYEAVADENERPDAKVFVERSWPGSLANDFLWEAFPRTREIILVRDFRDVVASILAYNRMRGESFFGRHEAGSDEEFVKRFAASADLLVSAWRQHADRTFLLRYEDFVSRPEGTLASLLEYLGLQADSALVANVVRSSHERLPSGHRGHRTSRTAHASIGRWRRDLDEPVLRACEVALGDALAAVGYESPAGTVPRSKAT